MTSVPAGILLPSSVLETEWFTLLVAFVAMNTIIYVATSLVRILPRIYVSDWLPGRQRRRETRSIYPEPPEQIQSVEDPHA